jgi:hypothetical protein
VWDSVFGGSSPAKPAATPAVPAAAPRPAGYGVKVNSATSASQLAHRGGTITPKPAPTTIAPAHTATYYAPSNGLARAAQHSLL